jgi:aryl-alcohol dehydrogenase-like predicted oxidoreductase
MYFCNRKPDRTRQKELQVRYRPLGANGPQVSAIGFGAAPLGGEFGEPTRAVDCAIGLGIHFFDVSPYYGRTLAETSLGIALEGKRHRVILATKCGRYHLREFDFSRNRIRASIDESLARLRTDYVDLLQAHDIEFGDERQIVEETIPAMRELQREGKTRLIGISGLPLRLPGRVAEAAPVDTVLSYCRYNPRVVDLDRLLTPFLRERESGLINASAFHMGNGRLRGRLLPGQRSGRHHRRVALLPGSSASRDDTRWNGGRGPGPRERRGARFRAGYGTHATGRADCGASEGCDLAVGET